MTARTFIVDIDDGPDGGNGPALARAFAAREMPAHVVAFDPLSSGLATLDRKCAVVFVDPDAPLIGALPFTAKDRVIGTTPRANAWLATIAAEAKTALPAATLAQIAVPGPTSWLSRGSTHFPAAEHEVFTEAPDRNRLIYTHGAGYLLTRDGRVRATPNGEDAWFRLRALARRGEMPAFYVRAPNGVLIAFAMTVSQGKLAALGLMTVDNMHDHWRVALGRTIDAEPRVRAFSSLAGAVHADGLFHGLAVRTSGEEKLRLVALRTGPPTWLGVAGDDGGALIDAFFARRETKAPRLVPEGLYHVACPADRPVFPKDLLSRIAADAPI